jgi:hypothetical protein
MSTKTNFKRVALVAVAALGLGVLTSVAPANAADVVATVEGNSATGAAAAPNATLTSGISSGLISGSGAVSTDDTATVTIGGTVAIHFTAGDGVSVATVSGGTIGSAASAAAVNASRTVVGSTSATAMGVTFIPAAVGTNMVIKVYDAATNNASSAGGTEVAKLTVTVVAATSAGTLSASDSFATIGTGASSSEVTTSGDTADAYYVTGSAGYVNFTIHDVNDVNMPSTTVVSASATNGAVVSFDGTFLGAAASSTYGSAAAKTIYVARAVSGSAFNTVVTISINGVPWTTKGLTFVGDIASISLAAYDVWGEVAATGTDRGQVLVKVKDSAGNLIGGKAPEFTSASYNTAVTQYDAVSSVTTGSDYVAFTCSAPGTTEAQLSIVNSSAVTIKSNTLKLNCTKAVYSYTASLDKATYAPGDIAVLTITAKDVDGREASGISEVGASAAIAGGYMTPVAAIVSTDTFTAGLAKYSFIVGAEVGSYQMAVSLPAIDDAVTVPYSIKSSSTAVSNADVLKAIVSLIASINKQIAALQKALLKK